MRPALVRFFRGHSVGREDAEDLAQDVALRILSVGDRRRDPLTSGYLFRVALNLWRDRARRLKRERAVLESLPVGLRDELSGERVLEGEQDFQAVSAAMGELGERARMVFLLRRLEQVANAEIAGSLGISVSAVDKHIRRAVAHLGRLRTGCPCK